jgi:hypothetical protein
MADVTIESIEAAIAAEFAKVKAEASTVGAWIKAHGWETAGIVVVLLVLKGCL